MANSRKRRFTRYALWCVGGMILLASGYVSAWLAVSRAEYKLVVRPVDVQHIRPAFVPLLSYCESDVPGAGLLGAIWWQVNPPIAFNGTLGSRRVSGTMYLAPTLAPPRPASDE